MIQYKWVMVTSATEGVATKYYDGWYLFGFIPLYIRRIHRPQP